MHCNTSLRITSSSDYKTSFCSHQGMNRPDFENFFFFFILWKRVSPASEYLPASPHSAWIKIRTLTVWYYCDPFGYPIFYISSAVIFKSLVISELINMCCSFNPANLPGWRKFKNKVVFYGLEVAVGTRTQNFCIFSNLTYVLSISK